MDSGYRIMQTDFVPILQKLPPQGLTFWRIYDKFSPVRGCEKDMPSRDLPREKPVGARLCKLTVRIPLWSCGLEISHRVRPLKRLVNLKNFFPTAAADLLPQCRTVKTAKYTKYSCVFYSLPCDTISRCASGNLFSKLTHEWQRKLQPGWNRGILCIPPLIFSGGGYFFIPSPK